MLVEQKMTNEVLRNPRREASLRPSVDEIVPTAITNFAMQWLQREQSDY